jgi:hypothetical protein
MATEMISPVHESIEAWIHSVLDVRVSFEAPGAQDGGEGINVWLLELIDTPPARNGHRPPLQIGLRFLVTAFGGEVSRAHDRLVRLAFAAMEHEEFEIDLTPLQPSTWTALGIVPGPSFLLRVPLRIERDETPAKRVLQPLVMEHAAMASISGRVLGPGDIPLPRARVELTALGVAATTDTDGSFKFGAVPSEPRIRRLRVQAKGKEIEVQTDKGADAGDPLVIRFKSFEE